MGLNMARSMTWPSIIINKPQDTASKEKYSVRLMKSNFMLSKSEVEKITQ